MERHPRFPEASFDKRQADCSFHSVRVGRAGQESDSFFFGVEERAGCAGELVSEVVQHNADETPIDSSDAPDAVDYFLSDVATFGIANRLLFPAKFRRQNSGGSVDGMPRNSRFDSKDFQASPTAKAAAEGQGLIQQPRLESSQDFLGDKNVVTVASCARMLGEVAFADVRDGFADDVVQILQLARFGNVQCL